MFGRKYNVVAVHKRSKEKSIVFTGSQDACIEKILHLIAAKMDRPEKKINGESVRNFKFSSERKKKND